jgi:hypothetical protein
MVSTVWRKLDKAISKMIAGPQFLKQLQNHSGVELQRTAKTYSFGTSDVVEMENGDKYWIRFHITEQKAENE